MKNSNDGRLIEEQGTEGETVHENSMVKIRRSPRYFRFMAAGALCGVLAALFLAYAFAQPSDFTLGQIVGFIAVGCVACGIGAGAVIALIFDRINQRSSTTLPIEKTTYHGEGQYEDAGTPKNPQV